MSLPVVIGRDIELPEEPDESELEEDEAVEQLLRKVAYAPDVLPPCLRRRPGETVGRFRVLTELGEGGMGVVYSALDLESGQVVALKTRKRADAHALARLMNEFNAGSAVRHPNLVRLYEKFSIDNDWFFTMELVLGSSFLAYVRDDAQLGSEAVTAPKAKPGDRPSNPTELEPNCRVFAAGEGGPPSRRPLDEAGQRRLRRALRDLVLGVSAFHEAGKIHRDLKPANVLVTGAGRVVVLDFGLSCDARLSAPSEDEPTERAGTPAYMAPEQAAASETSFASDWYAVGVMLYEALTGAPPFEGPVDYILDLKRFIAPPPPSHSVPGVPRDLDELCVDLLKVAPEERPTGPEILRRLGI